jgi:hypothetical protein
MIHALPLTLFLGFLSIAPASAATFCHVETGVAQDAQVSPTLGDYLARYPLSLTTSWSTVMCPDGIKQGATATANGDGSYSFANPPQVIVLRPISLSEAGFIQLAQTAGGMTDAQLVACEQDSSFKALWIKFHAASTLDRDDPRVQAVLAALDAAGYLPNHALAVNAAWPTH